MMYLLHSSLGARKFDRWKFLLEIRIFFARYFFVVVEDFSRLYISVFPKISILDVSGLPDRGKRQVLDTLIGCPSKERVRAETRKVASSMEACSVVRNET